jgi:hypothetical protein
MRMSDWGGLIIAAGPRAGPAVFFAPLLRRKPVCTRWLRPELRASAKVGSSGFAPLRAGRWGLPEAPELERGAQSGEGA